MYFHDFRYFKFNIVFLNSVYTRIAYFYDWILKNSTIAPNWISDVATTSKKSRPEEPILNISNSMFKKETYVIFSFIIYSLWHFKP